MDESAVTIRILSAAPEHMRPLQRIIEQTPDTYERTVGAPPSAAEAQSIYSGLPEGKDPSDLFPGICVDGAMVGCAVLLADIRSRRPRSWRCF